MDDPLVDLASGRLDAIVLHNGQVLQTHGPVRCHGRACAIHNPGHHMATWPIVWRADLGLVERLCPHGTGHPDPRSVEWLEQHGIYDLDRHGCDGCCRPPASTTTAKD